MKAVTHISLIFASVCLFSACGNPNKTGSGTVDPFNSGDPQAKSTPAEKPTNVDISKSLNSTVVGAEITANNHNITEITNAHTVQAFKVSYSFNSDSNTRLGIIPLSSSHSCTNGEFFQQPTIYIEQVNNKKIIGFINQEFKLTPQTDYILYYRFDNTNCKTFSFKMDNYFWLDQPSKDEQRKVQLKQVCDGTGSTTWTIEDQKLPLVVKIAGATSSAFLNDSYFCGKQSTETAIQSNMVCQTTYNSSAEPTLVNCQSLVNKNKYTVKYEINSDSKTSKITCSLNDQVVSNNDLSNCRTQVSR